MKKKILAGLVLTILLMAPVAITATTNTPNIDFNLSDGSSSDNPLNSIPSSDTADIMKMLKRIVNYLFSILLVVAAIFIVIAAFYFVTAQGDPEKTKTARNFVLYALIGVLIGFSAKGLIALVCTIGGQTCNF